MYEVKEIENNIIIPQYRSNMKYLINNKDEMSDIAFKLKDNKLVYSHKLILQTQVYSIYSCYDSVIILMDYFTVEWQNQINLY